MSRVILLKPRRFEDERGWFSETYTRRAAAAAGIDAEFVQDNHSLSRQAGTVRGFHFQVPPHPQAKLVRCTAGRMRDYALDIRRGSPTFGRYVSIELTAANGWQLFIPAGFAHAFVTLAPDTEVTYKCTDYYAPHCDAGVRWDSVGIDWPLPSTGAVLSDKDVRLPDLAGYDSPFHYDGEPLSPDLG